MIRLTAAVAVIGVVLIRRTVDRDMNRARTAAAARDHRATELATQREAAELRVCRVEDAANIRWCDADTVVDDFGSWEREYRLRDLDPDYTP